MAANFPLVVGKTENGRLHAILAWEDSVVYVGAKPAAVQAAIAAGAKTAEAFKSHGLGSWAIIRGCPVSAITSVKIHEHANRVVIKYTKENGKTDSMEAEPDDPKKKKELISRIGNGLTAKGLKQSVKDASAFSIFFSFPMFIAGLATLTAMAMTIIQLGGGETELDSDFSGGRSARRGRGIAALLLGISNLIGSTGCILVTLALIAATLLYLFMKLKNRPQVIVFE